MTHNKVPLDSVTFKMKVTATTINLGKQDILALLRVGGHDIPNSAIVEVADDDLDMPTSTLIRVSFENREKDD